MNASEEVGFRWPEDFWERFLREHWGRRPGAFRAVADAPFGNAREHLAGLLGVRGRCEAGEDILRIYRGAGLVGRNAQLPQSLFARAEDGSVRGYVERLKQELASDEVACVLSRFDRASERVWRSMAHVLAQLFSALGQAALEVDPSVFFGCYRKTSFGVHKDDGDVLTFVLEGRKRFLLWPYAYLAEKMGASACEHRTVAGWGSEFDELRADALVLEGEAGDMLYWPATYWHVAESDGAFAFSLATRIAVGGSLLPLVGEASRRVQELVNRTGLLDASDQAWPPGAGFTPCYTSRPVEQAATAALDRVQATLAAPMFQDSLVEVALGAVSALGLYPPFPPDAELAVFEREKLAAERLRLRALPILIHRVDEDEMLVAAHGHVLRIPADPRLIALLERLNSGDAVAVEELLEPFARSPRLDAGDRSFESSPDEVVALLEALARFRALELFSGPV